MCRTSSPNTRIIPLSPHTPMLIVSKEKTVLIGERINPTGKSKLKEAIKNEDMDYILGEGLKQADFVDVLDVNMGVPGIDEPYMMEKTVKALQAVTDLPLQIDSSNPDALESAMRIYAGKPMVNSVNGKQESLDAFCLLLKNTAVYLSPLPLMKTAFPTRRTAELPLQSVSSPKRQNTVSA